MGKRRRGRECALQCIYQWDVTGHDPEQIMESYWESHPAPPEVRRFARQLFHETVSGAGELDRIIGEQAEHWRLDRMGRVERSILRLGAYEILHAEDTPAAVAIDEAIELAKRYCGEDAAQFVNGILDGIRARISGEQRPGRGASPAATDRRS